MIWVILIVLNNYCVRCECVWDDDEGFERESIGIELIDWFG